MDYKEKYELALGRAKTLYKNSNGLILKRWLEGVFPELKESEDERIRKALKSFFDSEISDHGNVEWRNGIRYGEIVAWLEKQGNPSGDAIITIYDGPEDIEGVRVQALGEDFVISLHDAENGKDNFTYDEAMQWLKDHETQTFNRKQAAIICIFINEINDKLEEAGGDPFASGWYTTNELYIPRGSCADYNARTAWCFDGPYGCFSINNRSYGVFRCRPSLAV